MGKRVRISNDSLNSYGTRVLTSGMDTKQYERNPVLLYMHVRGNVIGYVKDLEVKDGEVTGELVFDEVTELSKRCKKQYEFGSLKMVSAGLDILEMSDAPEHLAVGQTSPTITKSKLYEVSLVDIGANDDALVLTKDGKQITLGRDGACPLPVLNNKPNKQEKEMEQKQLALQLGLPETATEAEISAQLAALKTAREENVELKKEKEALVLTGITSAVEKAIGEKRIGADRKDQFVELGKKIGCDELVKVFAAMSPQVKLSSLVAGGGTAGNGGDGVYKKLGDVPSTELAKLREEDPALYKRLYQAEYGLECKI